MHCRESVTIGLDGKDQELTFKCTKLLDEDYFDQFKLRSNNLSAKDSDLKAEREIN